jgi:hypothetical protein
MGVLPMRLFKHRFTSGSQIFFEGILLTLERKAYTFATQVLSR